jgi:hypothetical protein
MPEAAQVSDRLVAKIAAAGLLLCAYPIAVLTVEVQELLVDQTLKQIVPSAVALVVGLGLVVGLAAWLVVSPRRPLLPATLAAALCSAAVSARLVRYMAGGRRHFDYTVFVTPRDSPGWLIAGVVGLVLVGSAVAILVRHRCHRSQALGPLSARK